MDEQIRIEEKAYFYTEKKDCVDNYVRKKKEQGYFVEVESVWPIGWVVSSYIWIKLNN